MPRRSSRRRSRRGGGVPAGIVGGVLGALSLLGLAGLGYVYATADVPPTLDKANLCPVTGPRSVTVVVLDTSDPMPDVTVREVTTSLDDLANAVPVHGLLEIRILDPAIPGGRVAFSRCNPGDGSNLSHLTANPELARRRWLADFSTPVRAALQGGLQAQPSKASPIMATLQRAAVDRFGGRAMEGVPKSLVLVSDMVEHGPGFSQYQGDLDFGKFRSTDAYLRSRPDLKGAEVRILLIQRLKGPDPVRLVRFWEAWVKDGGGHVSEAVRLQGAS